MKTNATEPPPLARRGIPSRMHSREVREMRKIEESIGYMVRHLDRPLRVSTLATEVNISLSHFFYLFKRHVGNTPMDYFIRLRLRRACHLLQETEMSVKAIAYTLGYDDPFYFSRIFKSFNRLAPSTYRSKSRELKARENAQGPPANSIVSPLHTGQHGFRTATILARQPSEQDDSVMLKDQTEPVDPIRLLYGKPHR